MNLVFAGTPAFAVPSLRALARTSHRLLAVFSQPDRPAGRGRRCEPTPVKAAALDLALLVHQPTVLRDEAERLRSLAPDLLIVVAYGQILTPAILAIPRHGCINVHASLLPRWRGAAPIARAIEAGDSETGITIMQMAAGLDTGDILLQTPIPIAPDDTGQTLHDRLASLGAETLVRALTLLERGELPRRTQTDALATYARKLGKEEARIDWSRPASVLARQVRAFNPWPVAYTRRHATQLRIWEALPETASACADVGVIVRADANGVRVQTGDGLLRLTRLQAEGGRALTAREFLNGHALAAGERLGI